MCGITGIAPADPRAEVDPYLLQAMTDIIAHRGPDGEGFHCGPGVGLGIRRLSIIDLQTGDQPFFNEGGSACVVCNGEIYNYLELREELVARGHRFRSHSDVEVIVHLYEEMGIRCLERLRGMFAFALWDAGQRELFLARDRFGIKPLDYALDRDGNLYFGSELKSILMAAPIDRSIDPEAVEDLFVFGFVLSPKTLFKEIKKILPGHYLHFRHGRLEHHKYYDFNFPEKEEGNRTMSPAAWAEAVADKLVESVRLHLRSDVPVCSWLSPGIDSSAITAIMKTQRYGPLQTFSLAFEEADHDELTRQKTLNAYPGYDLLNTRIVCTNRGLERLEQAVWHAEEPNVSGIHIAQMSLAERTAARFKVALTGEGSDEIFAGYPWHVVDKVFSWVNWIPRPLKPILTLGPILRRWKPWATSIFLSPREIDLVKYARMAGVYAGHLYEELFLPAEPRSRAEVCAGHPLLAEMDRRRWDRLEKGLFFDLRIRMPDFITHGLDRMSMSRSLEIRVPFLDHELVELSARIPSSLKLKMFEEKHVLRQAMRKFLPDDIVRRKKRGLRAPNAAWLRMGLPDFAADMLSPERINENGYFAPGKVEHYLSEHRRGAGSFARPLMAVLCVQAWHELFVKGCRPNGHLAVKTGTPSVSPRSVR